MALTKRIGFGVLFQHFNGTTYDSLGAVVDGVEGGDAKTTVIETAVLSDKYVTKAGGQVDSGEVTITIAYDPLDTVTTTLLTGLLTSSAAATWKILYPQIGAEVQQSDTFSAVVTGFKRTVAKDKMILADVTLSISGLPGFTGA